MAERQLPKLHTRVRFPSPAPLLYASIDRPHESIFPPRSRVGSLRRKTMALKLGADRGQTRGQYPAPPPEQRELKGLISVRSIWPQGQIPGLLRRGRNRIDGREEVPNCARHDTAVIGSKT